MRIQRLLLGAAVVVAAAATGFVAYRHAVAADGQPDLAGEWSGRIGFRDYRFDEDGGGRGVLRATMSVSQEGSTLAVALHVENRFGSTADYALTGTVGNGNFCVVNGDAAHPVVVSGHVVGRPPRMRMRGVALVVQEGAVVEMDLHLGQDGSIVLD